MVKDDEEMADEVEERLLNEEYKTWKKNAAFLYDLVVSHALEWPSLTVEWFPDLLRQDNNVSKQRLLLGTHTSGDEQNYVLVVEVTLPLEDTELGARQDDDDKKAVGGFGMAPGKVQPVQQLNHDGEVNRARYMPQNSFLIATKTVHSDVYVFDYSKHPSKPQPGGECRPDLRLTGHESEGYGLAWSPFREGTLISGSDDRRICLWDINSVTQDCQRLPAKTIYSKHENVVEDVAWHMRDENLFGSVGDDKMVFVWDTRVSPDGGPRFTSRAHNAEVNCIAFNPLNEWLVATGSTDRMVILHDLRKMGPKMHSFIGHSHDVFAVNWNPKEEGVLASCGADRRLLVWDLGKIGNPQTEEEKEEGVPELLFIHGGHTAKVSDFAWNHNNDWVISSVAEDNILQIWQMAEEIRT